MSVAREGSNERRRLAPMILVHRLLLGLRAWWMRSYLRFLRYRGAHIGRNVYAQALSVEEGLCPLLRIEDDVVLAHGVRISLHDSALNNVRGAPVKYGRVTIRRGAYIGTRATILCGVEIGEDAVIGACSLVTKDVPPRSVAYGAPARVVGSTEELEARFRARMAEPHDDRFAYVALPPWREQPRDGRARYRDILPDLTAPDDKEIDP